MSDSPNTVGLRSSLSELITVSSGKVYLEGMLELPENPQGIVLFAHGSGSSRLSPRNNFVARELRAARLGTLLIDLLTREEDQTYETRFDISLLTDRLADAAQWLRSYPATKNLALGLFGASTGAAAALRVAADFPKQIAAVVSRGGRPDLTGNERLARVAAPTLLIVGGHDFGVIELNQETYDKLKCEKELTIVPGATHLFEEPGALEKVASIAASWFARHLD
ncbi:MAG TPA: dienelactone hydrolase family protein [Burkholderiales bacterium]|nr:dienelactone hydrolase family protein [Burkholderiales bacterium]